MDENLVITDELLTDADNIFVGGSSDDSLLGNSEDNILRGFGGNDTLDGAEGNDTLAGGSGDDVLQDNAGSNVLRGGGGNDLIVGGDPIPRTFEDPIPRFGDIDDDLYGGRGNDTLDGGAGFDRLTGRDGQDVFILSAPGTGYENVTDFVDGEDKIQVPEGLNFNDLFISKTTIATDENGSSESFVTVSNRGTILGVISSLNDPDLLTEADFVGLAPLPPEGQNVIGTENDDFLVGGAGNDTLRGLGGNDTLDGGDGNDFIQDSSGQNTYILRQNGLDSLVDYDPRKGDRIVLPEGLTKDDIVIDFRRDDFTKIQIAPDATSFRGKSIAELTASFGFGIEGFMSQDIRNSFLTFEEFQNSPTEPEANNIIGTEGDDSLFGTAENDNIDGLAGNDTLDGAGGNDTLAGGAGNNTFVLSLDGSTDELADYNPRNGDRIVLPEGITAQDLRINNDDLDLPPTIDLINSETGATQQTIAILADPLAFGLEAVGFGATDIRDSFITFAEFTGTEVPPEQPEVNEIVGTEGDDSLAGTEGDDTISGLAGNDTLDGLAGNDVLDGGEGDDSLLGGSENDLIVGGAGRDTIIGGTGNDTLNGGTGSDSISGGEGQDTFVLSADTINNITDFDFINGSDRIVLPEGVGVDDVVTGGGGGRSINLLLGTSSESFFASFENEPFVIGEITSGKSTKDIVLESLVTWEDFQANG